MRVSTSCNLGTFDTDTNPSANREADKIGSAAFLEPDILTSPFNCFPPLMTNLLTRTSSLVLYFTSQLTIFTLTNCI